MILLLSNPWHCFSFATGHYISSRHFMPCSSNVTSAKRNICNLSDERNSTVLIHFRDWSFSRAGLYFLRWVGQPHFISTQLATWCDLLSCCLLILTSYSCNIYTNIKLLISITIRLDKIQLLLLSWFELKRIRTLQNYCTSIYYIFMILCSVIKTVIWSNWKDW